MRTRSIVVAAFAMTMACSASRTAPPPVPVATDMHDLALEKTLTDIASRHDGIVAVTVAHLGAGVRASVNGAARLPMMSVFKLPLAVVALRLVESKTFALDQMIAIEEHELRPGVSPIAEAWAKGTHSFSFETLIRRSLQDSDNTAGDKLVALSGGGPAATGLLRARSIVGIDIAEQEIEIFARLYCPGVARPPGGWTFPLINACPKPGAEVRLAAAQKEIDAAPNGATTDALVDLLVALDRGTVLDAAHGRWLSDTLAGTTTGPRRLKGQLPPGTRVEHKTGTGDTIEGVTIATNDAGVVTLPNGQRFAIAVLTAGSRRDIDAREASIAELARAAWDRFVAK